MEHDLTNTIAMEPGQKVKYDAGQKKMEKTENESMISSASWKKGVLNFKDMEFREVLDKLKNIYGKSFKCEEEELLSKTIYLGVPYSDWEAVRQALELSLDIQFIESGNIMEITSN
jgi:ferric-dicitrate binding protein FerR (iron transport regulator)